MKILFLTRWYPPYGGIFIERHAQAVALHHKITILAILPRDSVPGPKPGIDNWKDFPDCPVIRCFYRPSQCRVSWVARLINLLRFFLRSIAGYRIAVKQYGSFDILHAHILTRAAVLPFLLHLMNGKPYIISEHWTRYFPENWGFTGLIRRMLTRLIVSRASAVTTVSGFLKNAMQVCGLRNKKFIIIPNTVDTTLFTIAEKRAGTQVQRILHVSNFHERAKNIYGILRVIRILSEQRKDFDILFIGGDEPFLGETRKYASGLGLVSPHVIFKGPVKPTELAATYQESSFLLMFSNFESFSVVIPEALCCGIPVLATSAGGIPEYFSEQAGRLTAPGDEAGLLDNLNFMLDNYLTFDPEKLRSHAEHRFGPETVGSQFDELYRSILFKKGNSAT
ncbi:MAG: glycosyltransferase family 4 protein [Bacteroidetes bacterium]|nr:glycosyltransferase family 4 protein [Bacteroidota bacterium]